MAARECTQGLAWLGGTNDYHMVVIETVRPRFEGVLVLKENSQKSREFNTLRLVWVDKGDICLPQKTYVMAGKTSEDYPYGLNHRAFIRAWLQIDWSGPHEGNNKVRFGATYM